MAFKKNVSYKKQTQVHYLSEFDNHKKICELSKDRSPIKLLFCTNDFPDEWLIDVVEYKGKSKVITDTYYVTAKEMPTYIKWWGSFGHDIITYF